METGKTLIHMSLMCTRRLIAVLTIIRSIKIILIAPLLHFLLRQMVKKAKRMAFFTHFFSRCIPGSDKKKKKKKTVRLTQIPRRDPSPDTLLEKLYASLIHNS